MKVDEDRTAIWYERMGNVIAESSSDDSNDVSMFYGSLKIKQIYISFILCNLSFKTYYFILPLQTLCYIFRKSE